MHSPGETVSDPQTAIKYLVDGNKRYIENKGIARDSNESDRKLLKDIQRPFAAILTCSDSRVDPAIYLDQKLGDIFVVRNAGNVAEAASLGSVEYAVEHLHCPLVAVIGHSSCGAVAAAIQGGHYPSNLQSVVDKVKEAIKGETNPDDAIFMNIKAQVRQLEEDPVIEEAGAKVIGAFYNIETGLVTWL